MENILEIENLTKRYGNVTILDNLNMHVEKGAIYGLIGKNGAGKTTLIRILTGLQIPTSGSFTIYGIKNTDKEIATSQSRMGAIVETPSIYQELSARDNLRVQFKLIGNPSFEGIDELLRLVGLSNCGKKKARYFSLGMKQRLGIAIALSNNPDFLILDEPINGLDPEGIIEIRELILKLNQKKNITILVSSHYLDELSKIATHYGFLDDGKIIKEITRAELQEKMEARIELKVDKTSELVPYFAAKGITYKVIDEHIICVYGNINLAKLLKGLYNKGFAVQDVHEYDASLENYYVNLIGGQHD